MRGVAGDEDIVLLVTGGLAIADFEIGLPLHFLHFGIGRQVALHHCGQSKVAFDCNPHAGEMRRQNGFGFMLGEGKHIVGWPRMVERSSWARTLPPRRKTAFCNFRPLANNFSVAREGAKFLGRGH